MKLAWVVLAVWACLGKGWAPALGASEGQAWGQWLSQGKLANGWRLWGELQPRYSANNGNFSTVLLRPGVGKEISETGVLWVGYAWTPMISPSRDEHRLWLQLTLATGTWGIPFAHRFRLEGRFIEGAAATALRARYLLRWSPSLGEGSGWSAVIYDEVFVALNDARPVLQSGFDQNRLFVGFNHRFSTTWSLDLGYLWNVIPRSNPAADRRLHVAMATLFHAFDWSVE